MINKGRYSKFAMPKPAAKPMKSKLGAKLASKMGGKKSMPGTAKIQPYPMTGKKGKLAIR